MQKRKPQSPVRIFLALILNGLFLISLQNEAAAQQQQPPQAASVAQNERERGGVLLRQGDAKGAVKAFREATKKDKTDADAWHSLGLAYNASDDLKNAQKAFETAIKLRPDFAASHTGLAYTLLYITQKDVRKNLIESVREAETALTLDPRDVNAHYLLGVVNLRKNAHQQALEYAEAALKLKADFSSAWLLKYQAVLGLYAEQVASPPSLYIQILPEDEKKKQEELKRKKDVTLLKLAMVSLEQFLKLTPNGEQKKFAVGQLESLRIHVQHGEEDGADSARKAFRIDELTQKARIIYKPEAAYTEAARGAQITGTVILLAVLASDGTIKYIFAIKPLPYGLTEAAIKAAQGIKFTPAMKEGRSVSQFIQIEYSFNLY